MAFYSLSSPIKTLFSNGILAVADTTADILLVKLKGLTKDNHDDIAVAVKVLLV